MSRTMPFMGKNHPLTGVPIRAIGFRPDGSPLWPIMGGDPSNDPPERPEDVTEDEWSALGDPGKQAIVRVRQERDEARTAKAEADRALAASKAKPTPPKAKPLTPQTVGTGDQPDIAAIVQQAVDAAVKPFREAEDQRTAETAAEKVRTVVLTAAKDRLLDATDALQIDLTTVLDDQGVADPAKVTQALDGLLKTKPHLAKSDARFAPPGIGAGGPPASPKDRVSKILADMQRSTGVRLPSS